MTNTQNPSAFITVNKSRKKIYKGNQIFLQDNQNFQLELFNPTTDEILAKISLNGTEMKKGIILRPGQRIFLDRFTDIDKKFVFETYEVSNTNKQVKEAIKNNGVIDISFYNKGSYTWGTGIITTITNNPTITINSPNWNVTPYFNTLIGNPNYTLLDNISCSTASYNSSNAFYTNTSSLNIETPKTIETGRISEGEKSYQKLVEDKTNKNWNSFSFASYTYHLLPESTRPLDKKDLDKRFCTECGAKVKNEHKFCSSCGNKL